MPRRFERFGRGFPDNVVLSLHPPELFFPDLPNTKHCRCIQLPVCVRPDEPPRPWKIADVKRAYQSSKVCFSASNARQKEVYFLRAG